ncbi:MAG: Cys-tRNA(Pro) deacylase [Candidatus Kapabacteria bacterium]|nr:Cys-tRNA(Pro) deacylase [Candidatus Kapabacteria bacterium]
MSKDNYPITPAIRQFKDKKVSFMPFLYEYVEKGGTAQTALELNVQEHSILKTLVMQDDNKNVFIVLMHGDLEVSTKELARQIGVKNVFPSDMNNASKVTGYQFGGTSPFGTKKQMKVYIEKTILDNDNIYINGGKRGFIINIKSKVLTDLLDFKLVEVGIKK